ncbi:MAG: double zinc ribbon domain-containing protein [Treponema sp.]|nr:double zinc ribbon domain-containing protein [Treponema sp.]
MKILKNIFLGIKNILFPDECVICYENLTDLNEIRTGMCLRCLLSIKYEKENRCYICGKPLISENEICLQCRTNENRIYERIWMIFPYTGKYRNLLAGYKFKKNLMIINIFLLIIKEVIENEVVLKDAVIVPVPPRPGKIKNTGWDQIEYLVRQIEKQSNIKVNRCLKRIKSKTQKQLNRNERKKNLEGRILINGKAPETALVIDDVITTGSTMEVCALALKKAGTKKVYGLCLFYD